MVFATAYRIAGNAADAEDVLHTVFLRLLRHGERVIAQPESYLRRAAVNAALDLVKSRRFVPADLDQMEAPPENSGQSDLRDALRNALARLPGRTAEAFALRYFEDLRNPEIAELLGLTRVGVAVTLHRARRMLKEELIKAGVRP